MIRRSVGGEAIQKNRRQPDVPLLKPTFLYGLPLTCPKATEGLTGSSHREVMSETYLPELPAPELDNPTPLLNNNKVYKKIQ